MTYVYLTIAIIAEVCGTSFMKLSDGFTKLYPSLIAIISYVIAFYFVALTLRTLPTGVTYAIWSGVGIVLIAAIAWIFQGQRVDPPALFGMAMIIVGVVIINVSSKVGSH